MFKRIVFIYVLLLIALAGFGQENKLATEYYRSGEYEKAATLFHDLYKKTMSITYLSDYFKSLLYSERYDEALKALQNHLGKRPNDIQLYVWEAHIYEKLGNIDKAEKNYRKALDLLGNNMVNTISAANAFLDYAKYDYAIEAYEKGIGTATDKSHFYRQIGEIYSLKGENDKMIDYYLLYLKQKADINQLPVIKNNFARQFGKSDFAILESKLDISNSGRARQCFIYRSP